MPFPLGLVLDGGRKVSSDSLLRFLSGCCLMLSESLRCRRRGLRADTLCTLWKLVSGENMMESSASSDARRRYRHKTSLWRPLVCCFYFELFAWQ